MNQYSIFNSVTLSGYCLSHLSILVNLKEMPDRGVRHGHINLINHWFYLVRIQMLWPSPLELNPLTTSDNVDTVHIVLHVYIVFDISLPHTCRYRNTAVWIVCSTCSVKITNMIADIRKDLSNTSIPLDIIVDSLHRVQGLGLII